MHFSKTFSKSATSNYLESFKQDGVDLVSFDFFDTLVFRKSVTHYRLWKNQSKFFFMARSCAEIIARTKSRLKGIPEVTGAEIYSSLLTGLGHRSEFEFEAEKLNLVANIETTSFLKQLLESKIKVCIISDTHYTQAQIEKFMDFLGIPLVPVFTSEKFLQTKSTGLFEKVSDYLDVTYGNWVHIGDNPKSDIESANSLGISTLQYLSINKQLVGRGVLSSRGYRFLRKSGAEGNLALSIVFMNYLHREEFSAEDTSGAAKLLGLLTGNIVGSSIATQIHIANSTDNYDLVLYSSRDGWLPFLRHKIDFPEDSILYFKTSREMLNDPRYHDYVTQILGSNKKILIFDLGWRGTTLKYLEKCFPAVTFTGYYWQLLGHQSRNQVQLNPGCLRNRTRIWRSRDFIETLFTDDSNGYDSIGHDLIPIEREQRDNYSKKIEFLEGASSQPEVVSPHTSLKVSSLVMESLVRYPSSLLISVFSDVTHTINGKSRGKLITDTWRNLLSGSPVLWTFGSSLNKQSPFVEKYLFKVVLLVKEIFQRIRYFGGRLLKRVSMS